SQLGKPDRLRVPGQKLLRALVQRRLGTLVRLRLREHRLAQPQSRLLVRVANELLEPLPGALSRQAGLLSGASGTDDRLLAVAIPAIDLDFGDLAGEIGLRLEAQKSLAPYEPRNGGRLVVRFGEMERALLIDVELEVVSVGELLEELPVALLVLLDLRVRLLRGRDHSVEVVEGRD